MKLPSPSLFLVFTACMTLATPALAVSVDPCGSPTLPGARNCKLPDKYGAVALPATEVIPNFTTIEDGHALRFGNGARFDTEIFVFSSQAAAGARDGTTFSTQEWYQYGRDKLPHDGVGTFSKAGDTAVFDGVLVAGEQFANRDRSSPDPVVRLDDVDKAFRISLTFAYRGDGLGNDGRDGPVKELNPIFYVENGGFIDANDWSYFDIVGGTMVGMGLYSGLELSLHQASAPAQSYAGANNVDHATGLFAEFGYRVSVLKTLQSPWLADLAAAQGLFVGWDSLSDADETARINIDWDVVLVPEPAGLGLFGLALAALAAGRRLPARRGAMASGQPIGPSRRRRARPCVALPCGVAEAI